MDKTLLALAGLLLAASPTAIAQETGKAVWEEYDKLVDARKNISMLGSDALGDSIDLATGGLSFSATDISLPGNNKLPVSLTRSFTVTNRDDLDERDDLPFADWDLDLPRMSGTFGRNWPDNRCTGNGIPPGQQVGGAYFQAMEYWDGVKAKMPGGGDLLLAESSAPKPTDGNTYRWVTSGWTYFRCLGSIQNGSGQGFLAIASDGTKYWFDWMAQHHEPPIHKNDEATGQTRFLDRRVNVLYATKIEDRFGNTVTLTFTNAWNAPARLTRIASSDGRLITLTYNGRGHIATASDGTQTWTYGYSYPSSYRGTLTTVTQPDGRQWSIGFSQLSNAHIIYEESRDPGDFVRSCFNPGVKLDPKTATGTITHPSGATGSFTVTAKRHGRSNVPAACAGYTTPQNDPNDDVAVYPINWDAFSLTSKTLSGAGLTPQTWTYSYGSMVSWFYPDGGGGHPVCVVAGCEQPKCLSDDCAGISVTIISGPGGKWSRYIFGNSYRYNEGKLLRVEEGSSASNVLRVTDQYYVLAQSGQTFPTPIGRGVHPRGDSFISEYVRPLRQKDIFQNGTGFTYKVNTFDGFARPISVTRASAAADPSRLDPLMGIPTLTVPASNNTGRYTVSWTAESGVTRYDLEFRKNGGSWSRIYNSSGTNHSVTGQTTGLYDYRVRACGTHGCSSYSSIESTQVTLPPTGVPTLTAPASSETGSYTVSWTAVGGATSYDLIYRRDNGGWSFAYKGSALSKAFSGLSNGKYDHQVRACNAGGCAAYSAIKSTQVGPAGPTVPPTSAPTLSAPSSVAIGDSFTVSWTAVANTSTYVLEQSQNGGGWVSVYSGSALSKQRTMFPGSSSFRVKACNAAGCSAYSATRTVIEKESPCPSCQPETVPADPESQPDEGEGA